MSSYWDQLQTHTHTENNCGVEIFRRVDWPKLAWRSNSPVSWLARPLQSQPRSYLHSKPWEREVERERERTWNNRRKWIKQKAGRRKKTALKQSLNRTPTLSWVGYETKGLLHNTRIILQKRMQWINCRISILPAFLGLLHASWCYYFLDKGLHNNIKKL